MATLEERYQQYVDLAGDGKGNDAATGQPLKTFDEWLES